MAQITEAAGRRGHGSTTESVSDGNQPCVANKPASFSAHEVPTGPCGDETS